MLGVGPLDNRSESVQSVVCHEAQGSDPCAAPRVTGTGVCSYCRASDRRRGLEGPGLTPHPRLSMEWAAGRVASEASLSLACLLEEGFLGSSRRRRWPSGKWAILCPTQWPLSPQCHSQLLERSSQGAGADSLRRGAQGTRPLQGEDAAHRGMGRPWPSPPPHLPGMPGQLHEWDVGLGKGLEPPQSGSVSLWSSQHQVGALWTQHQAGLGDTAKGAGRGGPTGLCRVLLLGQEVGRRRAQWLSAAWALVGRGCLSRGLLHVPPSVLGTLSSNPGPTYLLDPSFSSSHVASPLPLEMGPASTPIPQTGSPLGVW